MANVGDYGLDFSWGRPSINSVQAGGYTFVCRYLSWDTTGKTITKPEYDKYLSAGLAVCLNWEQAAGDQKRGATGGQADGAEAYRQARALGAPKNTVIYFSADWDVQAGELATCRSYWSAAAQQLQGYYRLGVYGGYRVVKDALSLGYHGWQTYAWSYGQWANAHFRQIQNGVAVGGASVDRDLLMRPDAGFVEAPVAITEDDARLIAKVLAGSDTVPWDANKNYTFGGATYDTAMRVIDVNTKLDSLIAGGGADTAPVLAAINALAVKVDAIAAENAELRSRLSVAYAQ